MFQHFQTILQHINVVIIFVVTEHPSSFIVSEYLKIFGIFVYLKKQDAIC